MSHTFRPFQPNQRLDAIIITPYVYPESEADHEALKQYMMEIIMGSEQHRLTHGSTQVSPAMKHRNWLTRLFVNNRLRHLSYRKVEYHKMRFPADYVHHRRIRAFGPMEILTTTEDGQEIYTRCKMQIYPREGDHWSESTVCSFFYQHQMTYHDNFWSPQDIWDSLRAVETERSRINFILSAKTKLANDAIDHILPFLHRKAPCTISSPMSPQDWQTLATHAEAVQDICSSILLNKKCRYLIPLQLVDAAKTVFQVDVHRQIRWIPLGVTVEQVSAVLDKLSSRKRKVSGQDPKTKRSRH